MVEWIVYIVLAVMLVGGLIALSRPRTITDQQYEEMREKGSAVGNALQGLQEIIQPGSAEHLRKAKTEIRAEEDDSGDPPEPGRGGV